MPFVFHNKRKLEIKSNLMILHVFFVTRIVLLGRACTCKLGTKTRYVKLGLNPMVGYNQ